MAAASKQRRPLVDIYPIVFSNPGIAVKTENVPSDLNPNGDLILDPFGNIYCFVCQVRVPPGSSNCTQHLGGKKHDTNNKRFPSPDEKQAIRASYVQAALQQRRGMSEISAENPTSSPPPPISAGEPSTPPDTIAPPPIYANGRSEAPHSEIEPITDEPPQSPPIQRARKTKRLALTKKYQETTIDKSAFLKSLLSDDETESVMEVEQSATPEQPSNEDESENDSPSHCLDLDERTKPFGPLNFNPVPFPVSFEDMNTDETVQSETAANIRELLFTTPTPKKKAKSARAHLGSDGKGPKSNDDQASTEEENDEEYIPIAGRSKNEPDGEEGAVPENEASPEPLIILKDKNGDELPSWLLDVEPTQNVLYSGDSSVALHFEILQFLQFVSPTAEEEQCRSEMAQSVETIIKQLWPESTVSLFGSYATGLYLPTSDIDICIMDTPKKGELDEFEQLAAAIRNVTGFARRVHIIKAKVPLVKIIARKSGMNCDICIGRNNGPKNVPVIKKYLETYPALRPLLMIVKCFLQQRDLNETYSGGLGSYTLLLFVVSHLQMLKYNFPNSKANLGAVLQAFFQFYGRMFNLCLAGIRVKDNGCYFDKFDKYKTVASEVLRFSVEDPNDETNELGRNGYAASRVRKAFINASNTLINWRRDDSSASPTPLGSILQCDIKLQLRRRKVIEDMEARGLHPLRSSMTKADDEGKQTTSRRKQSNSDMEQKRGSAENEETSIGSGRAQRRGREPRSRDPRERDNQDWDTTSGERKGRERESRDRDPRLAKRRRSSHERGNERTRIEAEGFNYNASAVAHEGLPPGAAGMNPGFSSQTYAAQPGGQNVGPIGYNSISNANMYGEGVYGNQGVYGEYGAAPYQVSTPGYEYTGVGPEGMPAAPYDAAVYVDGSAHSMQQMAVPYRQEQRGGPGRRQRSGRKRNSYRSRSNYRGR
ncbi:unnamed protein product [Chondrus crispus]|uniref:Uncharacterized protein n=1 Tax=Chondrus crispus TaxID=2769 RepID=R7QJI3_CHOCR|nr:unnamed protein product [Chondrus crispus]CDF38677.1 unnamed protein product [Chondrus crispus]|eukprot:XP_005718582.1 unnamed protein product [Chondrus crispus]